jgi:transcriptional regulator with XRE-family HTH domain
MVPQRASARGVRGPGRAGALRASSAPSASEPTADLAPVVGQNLKRLRAERGLSLEKLAQASGVSRAMLGQVELGQSAPTINVLWKIAKALEVPFSAMLSAKASQGARVLRASAARRLHSGDGSFVSRALFPVDEPRKVEFYELTLKAGGQERADAHAPGTSENLVVAQGSVEIEAGGGAPVRLEPGDAMLFEADAPHCYRNVGSGEAVMFLVMTYATQTR